MQLHEKYPDQGHAATALRTNERARTRGLIELLVQAGVDIREGVSADLLERERFLRQQINSVAARARITDDRLGESDNRFEKELSDLTARLREVQSQIRINSPRYAALTQPPPLSLEEIKGLLDENTVLLEFGLARKQSWLWAVTRTSLNSYPADSALQTEIALLSKMLLGPVAEPLRADWKGKRLVIVGSGALEFLPFAALHNPANEGTPQPLIASHEIVNLPSASVLSIIRQESAGRTPAMKMVAVLADPVYETNDPRLLLTSARAGSRQHSAGSVRSVGPSEPAEAEDSPLLRSVRSMDRGSLSRLPFSREEANAIAALVPPAKLLKATDFRASRERATSGELSDYRIIHFATHGLVNSQHPELSGLVLSLVDEKGQPQDGFLRMNELFNLRLPADLVVLSVPNRTRKRDQRGGSNWTNPWVHVRRSSASGVESLAS